MSSSFIAACLQLTPGNDLDQSLGILEELITSAANDGAQLIALPEFATYLDRDSRSMRSAAAAEHDSQALRRLQELAVQRSVWLAVGSLVTLPHGDPEEKLANRSFLIAPDGKVAARYDKIHLFDAKLADGRTVGESRHYVGGDQAVVVDTPLGKLGMSVCYDVRFPTLYRRLALAGAQVLLVPAAFTAETGAAHWEPLLRARAIETGSFVLAAATTGEHPGNWHTYGHASIIDPWGKVLSSCTSESPTYCMASIDIEQSDLVRSRLPSLSTNPDFKLVETRYP